MTSLVLTSGMPSAQAAPVASWRLDQTHRAGASFKALVGPDVPVGSASFITDPLGESLALYNQSLVVADSYAKAIAVMPTQNLTVSMWVALDAGQQYGGLLGAIQDTGDTEHGWLLGYDKTHFNFALTSQDKKRITYLTGKTSFESGRWYHVAATYDGKTMSLYVNGVLDGQSTEQSGPISYPNATPFMLGGYKDDNEDYTMRGRIREAQISLDVLSPPQIAAQFQTQAALAQLPPAPLAAPAPLASPGKRKVLLIGTDGTRPDKMEATNTPNIHALIASSAYYNKAQTGLPSYSGPGWSSMLTGVWREKHGVSNNSFTGKNYTQYPDFLTRLEKINPDFSTFAAANWPPLLTTLSGGPLVSDNIDVKFAFRSITDETDAKIAEISADYLAHTNVDAAFVYLGRVDEVAHEFGAVGPEYTKSLENLDKYVGQIVSAVRSRPTYANEDWLILMSTDHGHVDKGGHGGASPAELTTFFLANGRDANPKGFQEPVRIVDVGVTALAHLGVKADPTWGLDGKVQALKTP